MANYLDKVTIQTPVKKFRDFDLSCQKVTTQSFMRPNVAYIKEFPKSKIRCNFKTFVRMQPLFKPVLGSVQVHNRAFFVPFRTVWEPFNNLITGAPLVANAGSYVPTNVPFLSMGTIQDFIIANSVEVPLYDDPHDFDVVSGTNRTSYKLTSDGRHYWKILRQLGYPVSFTINKDTNFSAMPLLCYAKVFFDWYFPAQYSHVGVSATVEGILQRRFQYVLSEQDFEALLKFTAWCYYKNDYFTAAWDSPIAPAAGVYDNSISIPDITASDINFGSTVLNDDGTPILYGPVPSSSTPIAFSQYGVDSLKALTNYMKRHQLVGSRVLDRYLADFGVSLSADKLRRCIYIGSQSFPIQFSEVLSNSDTDNAVLGDYAGKGVGYDGQGSFEYDTEEFGMFIVINSFEPDICYYQGFDRSIMHKFALDFIQGEYEKLGTQPIYMGELDYSGNDPVNDIFGFTPRYSEYKVGRDTIDGLFDYDSVNGGLMAWSTARKVSALPHQLDFLRGDDATQYQRIFYGDTEEELDKFILVHRCNIKVAMQASPMYDTYDFDEPEGDTIHMQANGVQV